MAKNDKVEKEQKIHLTIVVSGNPINIELNLNKSLKSLMEKAFKEANVIGDEDNWYFSDEAGNELNSDTKISDLGLMHGQLILLNQRAGVAGWL